MCALFITSMKQKRFYTRETRGVGCKDKFLLFFMIGWDDRIKKRVNYLSCIEAKGEVRWYRHLLYNTKCRAICFFILKYLLMKYYVYITKYYLKEEYNNINGLGFTGAQWPNICMWYSCLQPQLFLEGGQGAEDGHQVDRWQGQV